MEIPAFSDYRPSMSRNVLLVRNEIGRSAPSTRDLPPSDFRYGIRGKHSGSVAECFQWCDNQETPRYQENCDTTRRQERCTTSRRYREAPVDYITTNKRALKSGCLTARDFRDYKKGHYIPVKQEEKTTEEQRVSHQKKIDNMVHGISTPVREEIKDCMTYKTLNDAIARAMENKSVVEEKARRKKAMKPNLKTGTRSTKASRAHAYKPPPPPTEADTFKMKRFRNIKRHAIDDKW